MFSLLVNVFQYVNSKGIIDKYEKDIKKFKAKIEVLKNSNSEASLLVIDKNKAELLLTSKQSGAKEVSL